jgi:hypothetical protein
LPYVFLTQLGTGKLPVPCDVLITRPRSPTVCKNNRETEKEARAQQGAVDPVKKTEEEIDFYL